MQNVDDFGRLTVEFDDATVAEVIGHDLSISGIRNELSVIADFGQYDVRVNPNNEHELFLPDARAAGDLLFREKLPTAQGTSFPRPNQFHAHGYVNEMNDAVDCALEPGRAPQSGPMLAWDTLAVLMADLAFARQKPLKTRRQLAAVIATIGTCAPVPRSCSRMAAVASKPSISGIWTSIRITSKDCSRA